MKKTVKILTMVLALGICMSAVPCALGEGEDLGAEVQQQEVPKSVEVKAVEEAPKANFAAETQVGNSIEAPAEQPSAQATEEKTEVGNANSASDGFTEIEDLQTPLGLFDQNPGFAGFVQVARKGEGTLYYGDWVTLTAQISNVSSLYWIRWEVNCNDDLGWQVIPGANGIDYSFILTKANADYEYRVVLVTAA